MRPWLRRAGVIPVIELGVDCAGLAVLRSAGVPLASADAVAVGIAHATELALAASVVSAGDPHTAHARVPRAAVGMVAATMVTDVVVVVTLERLLRRRVRHALPIAKGVSVTAGAIARFAAQRALLGQELRNQARRRPTLPLPSCDERLSVVIPAFGEAGRISDTIRTLRAGLDDIARDGGLELVVVDDGSPDGTAEAARAGGADHVLVHPCNRGKGAAVRTGMLAAHGRTVAFTDADMSYGPDEIRRLLAAIEHGADVAVGNRRHRKSNADAVRSFTRRAGSAVFNALTRTLLVGGYADTQSGVKAFRGDVARALFSRTRIDGFAFDVELFHLVERDGYRLVEVPVSVHESEMSTVRVLPNAARVVRDVLRIRRWAGLGLYDVPEPAGPGGS